MSPGPEKQFDRQEVVEKAMHLFWDQGYEATGLTQLLEHMGIGRQSLYDTFGDKRSLFLEALDHYMRRQMGPALALLRAPGSPLGNVRRVLQHWLDVCEEAKGSGCLMGNSLAEMADDEEVARVLSGYVGKMETALEATLRKARDCGEISPTLKPRDLARAIMSIAQGLVLLSKLRPDPTVARNVLEVTFAMLQGE